ncbi:MAG: pyridoxal phosphate-dependent aminotransferase [Calditrichaeota bacterium]|nr:pyridoxal phosphate-dependent aminotransferase [Calditrichota bacterium]
MADYPVSACCEEMSPFIVMDILERAQKLASEGRSIIHLEIGEPDFDTPEKIVSAAKEALDKGDTHYTHSLGTVALREAICQHYKKNYNVQISPEQVIVTSGTSPALLLALSVLTDPGDNIILSNPGYACYKNFLTYLRTKLNFVNVYEEDGFQYRPEKIRKQINNRTRAILINSPSNPTGNLLADEKMEEIASLEPVIISDEIYHGLTYGARARSILEFTSRAIVLNGFSKLFAMTGWRLGYLILPPELVRPVQKMQQNLFICANSFVQSAGVVALVEHHPEIGRTVKIYDERRQFMIRRLREIGFGITIEPRGAFYVFANAGKFRQDSYEFAFELLEKTGVAVTPGIDFGSNGEGYLRFSYANSLKNISVAMDRLEKYLA